MLTTVTVKASELKAGDTVVGQTKTTLSRVTVGPKYVTMWDNCGLLLGRITKNAEVQVERAALVLTKDELFRVQLALDFETDRIKRLIEEEDTPGRRANLAVAEKLSERLSEV